VADRFLIERRLGHGSFGVVFQGKDSSSGETVALKSIRHQFTWEMSQAAVLLSRESLFLRELNGQGYPRHIQFIDDDFLNSIIVMQFVDGTSLSTVLSQGDISVDTTVEWIAQ